MRVVKLDCGDIVFTGEKDYVYSVNDKHVCLKCAMKNAITIGLMNTENSPKEDFSVLKEKYSPISVDEYVKANPWTDISKMSFSRQIS